MNHLFFHKLIAAEFPDLPGLLLYTGSAPRGARTQFNRMIDALAQDPRVVQILEEFHQRGMHTIHFSPRFEGNHQTAGVALLHERNIGGFHSTGNRAKVGDAIFKFRPREVQRLTNHEVLTFMQHELWHLYIQLHHPDLMREMDFLNNLWTTFSGDFAKWYRSAIDHLYLRVFAWQAGWEDFVRADIADCKRFHGPQVRKKARSIGPSQFIMRYVNALLEVAAPYALLGAHAQWDTERKWVDAYLKPVAQLYDHPQRSLIPYAHRISEATLGGLRDERGKLKTSGIEEGLVHAAWDGLDFMTISKV